MIYPEEDELNKYQGKKRSHRNRNIVLYNLRSIKSNCSARPVDDQMLRSALLDFVLPKSDNEFKENLGTL
ncbi:hypothetical protein QJS04_geneDACA024840 [Acorus gramineus]|uniref:Uncharacterized protein n=1 Tax=Acorus gramineus TaxID=55184 RepID=A0AAV9A0M7_ACOGR|nr:hypothetical protein QJS04_geneDACA024840 [Acorus gramineus]